jgi:perosamine synthetase
MSAIPLARIDMGNDEIAAVARVIGTGWITQGPEVRAFESEFAEWVGTHEAVATSSGTAALHVALRAAGVGPGSEVITVSHSFIATANAVRLAGAVPVFVDVERDTLNIDPGHVEEAFSPHTRAILCVHQFGAPADIDALIKIASRRGVPLIEDAACAIGSAIERGTATERIGRPHGLLACFSFHPRKLLSTGEGGMITTRDRDLAHRCRSLRNHGMQTGSLGFNYRLTDLAAAIGRVQLGKLEHLLEERRSLAERQEGLLADMPGVILLRHQPWARPNWQSFVVRLMTEHDPRRVIEHLGARGIVARPGIGCAHLQPAYATEPWRCTCGCRAPCHSLRESERASAETLILPLYPGMTEADQTRVVSALRDALS